MKVLVTGITGFTGRALVRHLAESGIRDIAGIARTVPEGRRDVPVRVFPCDIADSRCIRDAVAETRPDAVVHLAGLTKGSLQDLERVNAAGTQNLLDVILDTNPACRILIVSSAAVYGYAGQSAIGEDTPVMPAGDYGMSKAAQERVARERYEKRGAQVAIARPFNLVGPGQPGSFVCGRIVQQAVEIERGQRTGLGLFETGSCRDFIDVRDAVRAYHALVSHPDFTNACAGKIFNIGSGVAHSVSDVVSLVGEITGRTYGIDLPEDPPVVPVPYQQADISLIASVTGWRPEISLKESLADMIAAARKDH